MKGHTGDIHGVYTWGIRGTRVRAGVSVNWGFRMKSIIVITHHRHPYSDARWTAQLVKLSLFSFLRGWDHPRKLDSALQMFHAISLNQHGGGIQRPLGSCLRSLRSHEDHLEGALPLPRRAPCTEIMRRGLCSPSSRRVIGR